MAAAPRAPGAAAGGRAGVVAVVEAEAERLNWRCVPVCEPSDVERYWAGVSISRVAPPASASASK